jgi:hypothetical protein
MVVKTNLRKIANLRLICDDPTVFVKSQWQTGEKSVIFLIYRLLIAAYFVGIVAYGWSRSIYYGSFKFWFIYMTDWGLFMCMLTAVFGAILTTLYHFNAINLQPKSASYKVYWFLSNVSTVFAFVITVVYWSLLFDGILR